MKGIIFKTIFCLFYINCKLINLSDVNNDYLNKYKGIIKVPDVIKTGAESLSNYNSIKNILDDPIKLYKDLEDNYSKIILELINSEKYKFDSDLFVNVDIKENKIHFLYNKLAEVLGRPDNALQQKLNAFIESVIKSKNKEWRIFKYFYNNPGDLNKFNAIQLLITKNNNEKNKYDIACIMAEAHFILPEKMDNKQRQEYNKSIEKWFFFNINQGYYDLLKIFNNKDSKEDGL